jgi:hypothetical protein
MRKKYPCKSWHLVAALLFLLAFGGCKKDNKNSMMQQPVTPTATPTTLGLYEADSAEYKVLLVAISQIGTQTVDYGLVFDTGSGGMVIDADGILPKSMITPGGFNFSGDSTLVNGITITKQTTTLEYGVDDSTLTKVYGNLAYAPVTIGDQNGNVVVKRLPFFMYYKATDGNGNLLEPHFFDTFGVSDEYIAFSASTYITSPFFYFNPGNGLTRGFKLAQLNPANFSYQGTYTPNAVTLGLTSSDLSSSSGFAMNQLYLYQGAGYDPILPAAVTYGSKTVNTQALFDTGTSGYNYVEDPTAVQSISLLPQNTPVGIAINPGFNYSFNTGKLDNLTYIENPTLTGAEFTDFSIEFFLGNEYMLDLTHNKLGLKNN